MKLAKPDGLQEMYEKNLSLLNTWLQDSMQAISEEEMRKRIEVSYNDEGYPICFYHREGKRFRINGRQPIQETKHWYKNSKMEHEAANAIFLCGSGFGYPIFELFEHKKPHTLVVIFEEDLYLFKAMLYYFDWKPIIQTQKVVFLIGDCEYFKTAFEALFYSMQFVNCTVPTMLFTYQAMRNFKKEYKAIYQYVYTQLSLLVSYLGNDHQDNLIGLCNMVHNANAILENPCVSCLRHKYEGIPAFIISNGPSLDKNIDQLKKIQGRALLIAVESAILPLLSHGIKPDAIVVIERIKSTYEFHFKDITYPKDMALLSLAVADRRVFPSFSGEIVPIFREREYTNCWINSHLGDGSAIDAGGNVSHLAAELAVYMGANPIVLVGQDFAYGPGGDTHSKQSFYASPKGKEFDKRIKANPTLTVLGNHGELLQTNQLWIDFKVGIENKIKAHKDKTFVNATEGGARIEGTTCETLETVIAKICKEKISKQIYEIVKEYKDTIDSVKQKEKLVGFLEDVREQENHFRNLVRKSMKEKLHCRRLLRLSMSDQALEHKEELEQAFLKNLGTYERIMYDSLSRSYLQQVLFADYYYKNKLGAVDSMEKVTMTFQWQYDLFHHINIVSQSVANHLEAIREELIGRPSKRLSVCMITYNSSSNLRTSLQSLRNRVDEVIVLDIGSTDQTLSIAKEEGAIVCSHTWKDSFSEAKNAAMEQAHGKWVLFLQPNEALPEEAWDTMYELLENPNAEGYLFYTNYGLENYRIYSPVSSLRLLRNRMEYRFEYSSFERIREEQLRNLEEVEIPITNLQTTKMPWDLQLRKDLLKAEKNSNGEDCYIQYMYGLMYLNEEQVEESLPYFEKAYEGVNQEYLFAPHLYKCLALGYIYEEQWERALEVLKEGILSFRYYTDLLVLRSEVYQSIGKKELAREDLKECLDSRERPFFMVPGPEISYDTIQELLEGLE